MFPDFKWKDIFSLCLPTQLNSAGSHREHLVDEILFTLVFFPEIGTFDVFVAKINQPFGQQIHDVGRLLRLVQWGDHGITVVDQLMGWIDVRQAHPLGIAGLWQDNVGIECAFQVEGVNECRKFDLIIPLGVFSREGLFPTVRLAACQNSITGAQDEGLDRVSPWLFLFNVFRQSGGE